MILKLLPEDHSMLKEKADRFNFEDPPMDPTELFENLKETMLKNGGLGLAAPQVGIPYRVFVIGDPSNPDSVFSVFNPVIAHTGGEIVLEEGCLSFPGLFMKIERPAAIRTRFSGHDGYVETIDFNGYTARAFLHEFDHLEGITFTEKVSKLKLDRAKKQKIKLDKIRKKNVE
jgi:peptide deformylase